jgi:hypothetical protein
MKLELELQLETVELEPLETGVSEEHPKLQLRPERQRVIPFNTLGPKSNNNNTSNAFAAV